MQQSSIHVTIASTQEQWHGGEKQAALLAEGIRSRGHQCTILARDGGKFAQGMRNRDFEVITFRGRGRSIPALWKIRRTIKRLRPDVLLANDGHALTATGFGCLGMKTGLRVAARRVDFSIRSCKKFQQFADGVICVSNAVANVCRGSGLEADSLEIVHDGVEPSFAESGNRHQGRESLDLSSTDTLLLVVAKLTDHKGHRFLLDAMPSVLQRHANITLALAGDGELTESLQQQAVKLGIESRVRFLGYRNDVPNLLAAADIVVQPSHLEGLCSSLIDAMLAAKPIVATRAGGIPDLLDTEQNDVAWLVQPKSPDALASAIIEAIDNPSVANNKANAARERALKWFTHDRMVDETLGAFARIAQRRFGDQAASLISALNTSSSPRLVEAA